MWEPKPGKTGPGNEPDGWIRNRKTARRRVDGDPSTEYIAD
jgi:hypothetical protein